MRERGGAGCQRWRRCWEGRRALRAVKPFLWPLMSLPRFPCHLTLSSTLPPPPPHPSQSVQGTFYLHEYVKFSNPTRPPACVVLNGLSDGRLTPRVAEARAGREARKNWKETFRTVYDGRVISLKAFFALYNL
jgi:hypothetical protein